LDAVLGDEGEVVMLVEDIFLEDPGVLRKLCWVRAVEFASLLDLWETREDFRGEYG
jgi:hypothetical protein